MKKGCGITLIIMAMMILGIGGVFWFSSGTQKVDNLPWQAVLTPDGNNEVFGVSIGQLTTRQFIDHLQYFPETVVFQPKQGQKTLESYFGKQRIGLFEARIIAELAVDNATLDGVIQQAVKRKPQPSGAWRYELPEAFIQQANDFRVRYLIYIPVVNYDDELIKARFGQPKQHQVVDERFSYWFYPEQGSAIIQDQEGSEVFYYSNREDYPALQQRLLGNTNSTYHD